jgi:hypothetical protein
MANNNKAFKPTAEMELVKARVAHALEEREAIIDAESMTMEQLENVSGCLKLHEWAKDWDEFLPWLLDKDYVKHKIQASKALAVDKLLEILHSDLEAKVLTAKDWINAATQLLTLADAFPTKRKEVLYLDKGVANMTEEQVAFELDRTRTRLIGGATAVSPNKEVDKQ